MFPASDKKTLFLFRARPKRTAANRLSSDGCKMPVSVQVLQMPGPQIKPYIYTASRQESRKWSSTHCAVCEEKFGAVETAQKRLRLSCGDCAHYDCFKVVVECMAESIDSYQEIVDNMLLCKGPKCADVALRLLAIPSELTFRIFAAYRNKECNGPASNLAILSTTLPSKKPVESETSTDDLECSSKITVGELTIIPERPSSPSPTIATTNTTLLLIPEHTPQQLDQLRHTYIQYLLNSFSQLSLATLCELGTLRLVDNLLVSFVKDSIPELKSCYLFSNYLLVSAIDAAVCSMLPLEPVPDVAITNQSTFAISFQDVGNTAIWIKSDDANVLEKWIVATSDPTATFPSQFLTSTFVLPEVHPEPEYPEPEYPEPEYPEPEFHSDLEFSEPEVHVTPKNSSSPQNGEISLKSDSVFTDHISESTDNETDSDVDSDNEIILKVRLGQALARLQEAISDDTDILDRMLQQMSTQRSSFDNMITTFNNVLN